MVREKPRGALYAYLMLGDYDGRTVHRFGRRNFIPTHTRSMWIYWNGRPVYMVDMGNGFKMYPLTAE